MISKLFFKSILILTIPAMLVACNRTKMIYNNSDWFILKKLDNYFELNEPQRNDLKKSIDRLLAWHRQIELKRLLSHLTNLKARYANGLKNEDIVWIQNEHKKMWRRFMDKVNPDLARFLTTVDEKQIAHLESELEKRNEWLVRQTEMSEDELKNDNFAFLSGIVESWLGPLEAEQKKKINEWITPDPEWVRVKLENRRKFQTDIAYLLRTTNDPVKIGKQITLWTHQPEKQWTPEFNIRVAQKKTEWTGIILNIDRITTRSQRQNALDKLQGYIDDFQDMTQLAEFNDTGFAVTFN